MSPEKGKLYSEDEAREEAEILRGKVESGQAKDYTEAEKQVGQETEKELSPEVIEKIMGKVQDIDTRGIAYHGLGEENIEAVLHTGLLGQEFDAKQEKDRVFGKDWAKHIRKNKTGFVHFNIVGRASDTFPNEKEREISNTSYSTGPGKDVILFDISSYREFTPKYRAEKAKSKSFRANDHGFEVKDLDIFTPVENVDEFKSAPKSRHFTEEGLPKPEQEWGFVLSHRVAPRLFTGIIINPGRNKTPEEVEHELEIRRSNHDCSIFRDIKFNDEYERSLVANKKTKDEPLPHVEKIAKMMLQKNNKDEILPIYDIAGNLLWPKQMSYEEVKKFVTERDAGKKDKKTTKKSKN